MSGYDDFPRPIEGAARVCFLTSPSTPDRSTILLLQYRLSECGNCPPTPRGEQDDTQCRGPSSLPPFQPIANNCNGNAVCAAGFYAERQSSSDDAFHCFKGAYYCFYSLESALRCCDCKLHASYTRSVGSVRPVYMYHGLSLPSPCLFLPCRYALATAPTSNNAAFTCVVV